MTIAQIHQLAEKVKGFLDPEEGQGLYDVALDGARLGPWLEIGSYCGKSALYLGSACQQAGSMLFSVDHHCGSEEQQPGEEYFDPDLYNPALCAVDTVGAFRKTLRLGQLEDAVVPIVAKSENAARHWSIPLGGLFIDGGHAYETVLRDYQCWSPHIVAGGYLLIHDIFPNPDDGGQAPYLIYQMALDSKAYRALPLTKTLGVLKHI